MKAVSLLTLVSLKPLALLDLMLCDAPSAHVTFLDPLTFSALVSGHSLPLHALMMSQPAGIGSIVISVTVGPNQGPISPNESANIVANVTILFIGVLLGYLPYSPY